MSRDFAHAHVATLTGDALTSDVVARVADGACQVELALEGLARMATTRHLVDQAIVDKIPVYGVTTGLGSRANEALNADELADFSLQTIRGRAHAIGEPSPRSIVRASMVVRANTLLKGASAAQPAMAEHLIACLNAGVTPVVGSVASIGAGDLVWNATMALGLIGEGPMEDASGVVGDGATVLARAGISPPPVGPRDGLALCNHACHSAALASLGLSAATRAYEAAQSSAALVMEAFEANLTPLDFRVLALRPQPGQAEAAAGLHARLEGSSLHEEEVARRLQDPLSIRNVVQVHGALFAALAFLEEAVMMEINGASDNPVALADDQIILSAGAYHTPHLTNAVETVSRAFVHVSMLQLARLSKMMATRFTDLPTYLAAPGSNSNGFAPVMKTAESLVSALTQSAHPVALWPSINADGVEDSMTATPTAAHGLLKVADHACTLSAIELIVGAQAVDLRGNRDLMGTGTTALYEQVRSLCEGLSCDRPLGRDIEAVADVLRDRTCGLHV